MGEIGLLGIRLQPDDFQLLPEGDACKMEGKSREWAEKKNRSRGTHFSDQPGVIRIIMDPTFSRSGIPNYTKIKIMKRKLKYGEIKLLMIFLFRLL